MKLNPQQLEAVKHLNSPLLVIAGAGSGKTGVITQKIAYLIRQAHYSADKIFAVTFTNKASREMKERCTKLLGQEAQLLNISTFHRLGLDIVRAEHQLLGLRKNFCILDAQDCQNLVKDILQSNSDGEAKDIQTLISFYKNENISPESALSQNLTGAGAYLQYTERLRAYNVLDFDDLLLFPLHLFQNHREALLRWQNKIDYLLIDEYQDTNQCQYHLMKLLIGHHQRLTVVGDDDQSIYAWRGAKPENLNQLGIDFPNLKTIKLEQNYRCHQKILEVANQLISHNTHFIEKKLWSDLKEGEGVTVYKYANDRMEAETIAAEIDTKMKLKGWRANDFAILYRSNYQSRVLEEALREKRINYEISGGISFLDHSEIRDLIAYLRLINNPYDDSAFIRICNVPKREIGTATIEKLSAFALQINQPLFIAGQSYGLETILNPTAARYVLAFTRWIESLQKEALNLPAVALINLILEQSEYERHLYDLHGEQKKVQKRLDRLNSFKNWIKRLGENEERLQELETLMNHLNLREILSRQDNQQDAVQLMTLHSAKGLEFRHVFIIGCEDDLIPHTNSGESVEEERRLFYVGMTRAKENLHLSYCEQRNGFLFKPNEKKSASNELLGEKKQPSRFFNELPEQGILWLDGKYKLSPEEDKALKNKLFADLDDILNG